jgi:hypothetical protein
VFFIIKSAIRVLSVKSWGLEHGLAITVRRNEAVSHTKAHSNPRKIMDEAQHMLQMFQITKMFHCYEKKLGIETQLEKKARICFKGLQYKPVCGYHRH